MTMIENIKLLCKEYKYLGGSWILVRETSTVTSDSLIKSMLTSQPYFIKMGGLAKNTYKFLKKFGRVISKIECVNRNGMEKSVYSFSYKEATVR